MGRRGMQRDDRKKKCRETKMLDKTPGYAKQNERKKKISSLTQKEKVPEK